MKGTRFEYFPGEYRWSGGLSMAIGATKYGGGEIGEVDRVGRKLREHMGDDNLWYSEWVRMGQHVETLGTAAEKEGHNLTAANCFLRACNYIQIGERYFHPKTQESLKVYKNSVNCFHKAATLLDQPIIEVVEVPFNGKSLPAYLVTPKRTGKHPVVVFFDGLDTTKEILYFAGVPDLVRRGIGCLIVDGPGNGESIRFREMVLRHDYEKPASATLDYLQTRQDVDMKRVGVMGISLGGYYASRAAAFETRFKICVVWGAIYDYYQTWKNRIERSFKLSMSVPGEHIKWILGVNSYEEALSVLEDYKLEGVANKIACKFLLVHGEEDKQIPLEDAKKLFEAVGSTEKTLKIFTAEEGGSEHCQGDNRTLGQSYIFDWIAGNL